MCATIVGLVDTFRVTPLWFISALIMKMITHQKSCLEKMNIASKLTQSKGNCLFYGGISRDRADWQWH
jgi:hypothetical protein